MNAQKESLRPLLFNKTVNDQYKKASKLKSAMVASDTISLPFFDDFSELGVYPDQKLWSDSFVYINSTFPVNPISIGVATFDALDQKGELYPDAINPSFTADKLTSQPIKLNYHRPADSIYLSFYYQPGGLGQQPGINDSLLLYFYTPWDTSKWRLIWFSLGDSAQFIKADSVPPFKLVMIPITDTAFLYSGFRFQFRNIASINFNLNTGEDRNGDNWNIDYVYLNKNRTYDDTIFRDVAVTNSINSLLNNYESMPWKHFIAPNVYTMEWGGTAYLPIRNNGDTAENVGYRYYITDTLAHTPIYKDLYGNKKVPPYDTTSFIEDRFTAFFNEDPDSGIFEVKAALTTAANDFCKINDTTVYYQTFLNYYAYDDGSAELGYGFVGEGIETAQLAYRFYSYETDTLQAIDMYFNPSLKETNDPDSDFTLAVWNDNSGRPDSLLYFQEGVTPKNNNRYDHYFLNPPIIVSDTFYVGWQQVNNRFLNVGFDRNRIHNDKIFYNLTGLTSDWTNSSFKGSLMIRPVLGSKKDMGPLAINQTSINKLTVYPNPASSYINIMIPGTFSESRKNLVIFDMSGKTVYSKNDFSDRYDISILKPGIYMLRVTLNNGTFYQGKLIKTP